MSFVLRPSFYLIVSEFCGRHGKCSMEGAGETCCVLKTALECYIGNSELVIGEEQLLGVIHSHLKRQLLGCDAKLGLDAAVELPACDVELLGNSFERHFSVCHVRRNSSTKLGNKFLAFIAMTL